MSQYDNYSVAPGQIGNRVEQYLKGLIEEQKRTISNLEKRLKATEQKVGIYQVGDVFYPGYQNNQVQQVVNNYITNEGDTITSGGSGLYDIKYYEISTEAGTKWTVPEDAYNKFVICYGLDSLIKINLPSNVPDKTWVKIQMLANAGVNTYVYDEAWAGVADIINYHLWIIGTGDRDPVLFVYDASIPRQLGYTGDPVSGTGAWVAINEHQPSEWLFSLADLSIRDPQLEMVESVTGV